MPHEERDYQSGDSSDGEVWEEPTPYPPAAVEAASVATSSTGVSGAAGLRLPPPINTNTSPSSSQPSKAAAPPTKPASPTVTPPMFAKRLPLQADTADYGE